MSVHLFLISADPSLSALAARAVTGLPIHLQTAQSLTQAQAMLAGEARRAPLVLLVDLVRGDYLQARQWVQQWAPAARAFFIAPQGEPAVWTPGAGSAEELRAGAAVQILPRPGHAREQAELFGRILSEATVLADVEGGISGFDDLIGRSVAFRSALEQATRAAGHDQAILLNGECGTGKHSFARAIHAESRRARAGFVHLNCRMLSYDTLGPDLFRLAAGRGTFEHALLREASGGTLYLEEIVALDRRLQSRLLHFVDEMRLAQAQGAEPQRGARLIASSSQDPAAAAQAGDFLGDLLQRLRSGEIRVPPLRERPSDILLMTEHFLGRAVPHTSRRSRFTLSDAAKQRLIAYAWPGNVRELVAVLQAASLNAEGTLQIDVEHLPDSLHAVAAERHREAPAEADTAVADQRIARIGTVDPARGVRFTSGPVVIELPEEGVSFDDLERAILRAAMARTRGNVVRAARLLRLGRGSLRYRLEKHGIVQPKRRRGARRRLQPGEGGGETLSRAS
jgi:DNA-binding NtrC family response regulator